MDYNKLKAPFPRELVRSRPGQHGKQLSYVPTAVVVARLNESCESWDFTVEEHHEFEGTEVVVLGRLTIDGVVKSAFGGASLTKDSDGEIVSYADSLKAAMSDCIKKAASLFGVPIDGGAEAARPQQPARNQTAPRRPPEEPTRDQIFVGATVRQLSAIHSIAKREGLNQQRLRELVAQQLGKQNVSHLSKAEASSLIDFLKTSTPAAAHH